MNRSYFDKYYIWKVRAGIMGHFLGRHTAGWREDFKGFISGLAHAWNVNTAGETGSKDNYFPLGKIKSDECWENFNMLILCELGRFHINPRGKVPSTFWQFRHKSAK